MQPSFFPWVSPTCRTCVCLGGGRNMMVAESAAKRNLQAWQIQKCNNPITVMYSFLQVRHWWSHSFFLQTASFTRLRGSDSCDYWGVCSWLPVRSSVADALLWRGEGFQAQSFAILCIVVNSGQLCIVLFKQWRCLAKSLSGVKHHSSGVKKMLDCHLLPLFWLIFLKIHSKRHLTGRQNWKFSLVCLT